MIVGRSRKRSTRRAYYSYSASVGGWTSDDLYPPRAADVTGDHWADILGFGSAGVYFSEVHVRQSTPRNDETFVQPSGGQGRMVGLAVGEFQVVGRCRPGC